MLEEIIGLSGIGRLDGAVQDEPVALAGAVAIHADNGCGKSTLACLLRSLAGNDCDELLARRTLGAEAEPHIELLVDGEKRTFSKGSWDKTHPGMRVFDDDFVENTTSLGRLIAVMQVEHLLEVALGEAKDQPDEVVTEALDEYADAVNARLRQFGAHFEVARLQRVAGDPPRLDYSVRLVGTEVPLAVADPTAPSFSTTLSLGDRRALALAFYFARLDLEPDLPGDTLVLDEPASGLDRRRTAKLVEVLVEYLARGVQLIVLSQDCDLLRALQGRGFEQMLQLRRSGLSSVLEPCDIEAVCATELEDDDVDPGFEPY